MYNKTFELGFQKVKATEAEGIEKTRKHPHLQIHCPAYLPTYKPNQTQW